MSLEQKLQDLFLLDRQVRGMRKRLDSATRRHKAQTNRLEQLQQQLADLNKLTKHEQAKAGELESQVQGMEARINELRQRMNSVTSNKEYSAILVEVNTLKVDKEKVEEVALAHLSKVDELKTQAAALTESIADQQKLVDAEVREVEAARAEVGAELERLTKERDAAREQLAPDVRDVFERAAEIHDGEAMAAVVEESRRHLEYSCGGCYMAIPIERLNTLMSRPDTLVTCPSCSRILYAPEALKSAMTKAREKARSS